MPDLGAYTTEVLAAYAIALLLLAAIAGLTALRATRTRRRLAEMEAKRRPHEP